MKKFQSIESFCESINKGTFGLYVGTFTEKKMNKYPIGAGRVKGSENPYFGRVFNFALVQNAATGVSYYKLVESECKREGISFSKSEFEQAFPKESTYCDDATDSLSNMIMQHEVSGQRYLRLYYGRKPTKTKYYTILTDANGSNAKVIDEQSAEYKDIMRYVPANSGSAKQEALGISNIIEVRQPKIENVVFMMQGDKFFMNERFAGIVNEETLGSDLVGLFR